MGSVKEYLETIKRFDFWLWFACVLYVVNLLGWLSWVVWRAWPLETSDYDNWCPNCEHPRGACVCQSDESTCLPTRENYEVAAKTIDWGQVVANGGPPCFHLKGQQFCLRAQRWEGHVYGKESHAFISLDCMLDSYSLWLPKSDQRRENLALTFEAMAKAVRRAVPGGTDE